MIYKEAIEIINRSDAGLVRGISEIYESMRQKNFTKWIDNYPEYWVSICYRSPEEITPEYAEEVMKTLIDSNIVELQMVWLFRCGNKITLDGKAASEES